MVYDASTDAAEVHPWPRDVHAAQVRTPRRKPCQRGGRAVCGHGGRLEVEQYGPGEQGVSPSVVQDGPGLRRDVGTATDPSPAPVPHEAADLVVAVSTLQGLPTGDDAVLGGRDGRELRAHRHSICCPPAGPAGRSGAVDPGGSSSTWGWKRSVPGFGRTDAPRLVHGLPGPDRGWEAHGTGGYIPSAGGRGGVVRCPCRGPDPRYAAARSPARPPTARRARRRRPPRAPVSAGSTCGSRTGRACSRRPRTPARSG
jgi:hypothetical protein